MCGISGILSYTSDLNSKDRSLLGETLSLQHHRGPDATGIWVSGRVALGHNRLSIIDLSTAADQPFVRDDLGLRIIFNGEIYNYKTLKKSLESKGYKFFTDSDTEVLVVGFAEYGESVCEHLVGMFAFCIWDERNDLFFMARDRFGEKPIFFTEMENRFHWASELNGLRTLRDSPLEINPDAVVDILENGFIHLHHTIYKEVFVFPPSHHLTITSSGDKKWVKYYSFPTVVQDPIPFADLKKATKDLLYKTVERELNSDVPLATFLSAGVDSALITAIAHDIKSDISAVTIGTNELLTDETEGAKQLARKLNINHEIVPVSTDSIGVLETILKDIQPLADASLIPSFLVTEQVKARYRVMLSGDGGDEIFGSYNKPNLYLNLNSKGIPMGEKLVDFCLTVKNPKLATRLNSRLNDVQRMKLAGWEGLYSKNNLTGGFFDQVFREGKRQKHSRKLLKELKPLFESNPEKLSFGMDFKGRLPGDFLFKVDSSSMHSSVEVRAPFLDHELVDFLMKVPTRSLMPNSVDKELSKSLLSDFSGTDWYAPKKGFTIPYWEYLQGGWGALLENYLREGLSETYLNFNQRGILSILEKHRTSPSIGYAKILFPVLVMEIWLRVFHLKGKFGKR
ncbi:asparagine synthase (glutamine-hydrolyzing) [Algoriphagus sp. A40]|uniref:asparagine synthase (glutamine-hydrolyzing) n=1 Tax=Algoriphagus sp. A40 TaxID=1945863 RepID=UPI000986B561|nr:asparagine synthase (glutamine-hydrolyzing) [Algoriphagus sp. A40]OOG74603.1 asparagine synthase (glutamine-hydrolyzing) [Algoriphagus sp. A40]